MTDKPDVPRGEYKWFTSEGEHKWYYNPDQRAVLAQRFGPEALPMLDSAAKVIQDLSSNPIGKVQACYCTAVRIRVIGPDGPTWHYVWPKSDGDLLHPERCPRKDGPHEWRTKEGRSGY